MSAADTLTVEWKCPRCGAVANAHGSPATPCAYNPGGSDCCGFLCECKDGEDENSGEHGSTFGDPCHNANCYHCGWGGTFPVRPRKAKDWEKKALAAGWNPPAGWRFE